MSKMRKILCLCLTCTLLAGMSFSAFGDNSAPVAENMEISTYRGIAVSGRLAATDPEGEKLSFEITTPPIKGELVLSEDGKYTYTPAEGKKGKDYFGYKATDESGNSSHEATVIIRIEKQKSKVSYSDMAENGAHYGAVRLAEEEIFVGECLGGEYIFSPDKAVSRGEFLAMCMKLSDTRLLEGVSRTGFADDGDIPQWQKPYVTAAVLGDIVEGSRRNDGQLVFSAGRGVTFSQAAVILPAIWLRAWYKDSKKCAQAPDMIRSTKRTRPMISTQK